MKNPDLHDPLPSPVERPDEGRFDGLWVGGIWALVDVLHVTIAGRLGVGFVALWSLVALEAVLLSAIGQAVFVAFRRTPLIAHPRRSLHLFFVLALSLFRWDLHTLPLLVVWLAIVWRWRAEAPSQKEEGWTFGLLASVLIFGGLNGSWNHADPSPSQANVVVVTLPGARPGRWAGDDGWARIAETGVLVDGAWASADWVPFVGGLAGAARAERACTGAFLGEQVNGIQDSAFEVYDDDLAFLKGWFRTVPGTVSRWLGARPPAYRTAMDTMARGLRFVDRCDGLFFAWIHLSDAVSGLETPEAWRHNDLGAERRDAGQRFAMSAVRQLLDFLDASGRGTRTLVVVVGLPGDAIGEVPLGLRLPSRIPERGRVLGPIAADRVDDTVLGFLGGEEEGLRPWVEGREPFEPVYVRGRSDTAVIVPGAMVRMADGQPRTVELEHPRAWSPERVLGVYSDLVRYSSEP